MTIWTQALDRVLGEEGGFQADPRDAGNWTGDGVGQGVLRGTKWGISAHEYPEVNIPNLTRDEAAQIYFRDYWESPGISRLPDFISPKVFDMGVNLGPSEAIKLLQYACNDCGQDIACDGIIGPITVAACQAAGVALMDAYAMRLEDHYRAIVADNPSDAPFLAGWLTRAQMR
jgi:lysozyme family protein